MTAEEKSCKNPRVGLTEDKSGSCKINIYDIKKDAYKVRLYDHHFDMYIDEFDDADEDFVSVGNP